MNWDINESVYGLNVGTPIYVLPADSKLQKSEKIKAAVQIMPGPIGKKITAFLEKFDPPALAAIEKLEHNGTGILDQIVNNAKTFVKDPVKGTRLTIEDFFLDVKNMIKCDANNALRLLGSCVTGGAIISATQMYDNIKVCLIEDAIKLVQDDIKAIRSTSNETVPFLDVLITPAAGLLVYTACSMVSSVTDTCLFQLLSCAV